MEIILIIITWLIGGTITTGAEIAYYQKEFPSLAKEQYRQDLARGIFWGFFFIPPISWFITLFWSGFYQHGISFKNRGITPKD